MWYFRTNPTEFGSLELHKTPVLLSSSIPPDYIAISDLDSTARSAAAAAAMMTSAAAAAAAAGGDPMSAPPNVAGPSGGGGMMITPSLRIEGCTPPSESSLDGEEQLYKCEWYDME